jgi:hypothetical protein
MLFLAGLTAACNDVSRPTPTPDLAVASVQGVRTAAPDLSFPRPDGGPPDGAPMDGPPPMPPKEAYEACMGKSSNDACDFMFMGMHVIGHCKSPDSQKPLVCAPDNMPPPRH